MKVSLLFLIFSFSAFGQIAIPTLQPQFMGGRATYNRNFSQPMQFNPQRMMPFNFNQAQNLQGQNQKPQANKPKQPLRAINNRYPANKSNTMQFGLYERINLRDSKKQGEAIKVYKQKLAAMRINLRAYRIDPVKPITPITPADPKPQPKPQPKPEDGDNPNNGEVGIGGGPGPVPPTFPLAVGMPAPELR